METKIIAAIVLTAIIILVAIIISYSFHDNSEITAEVTGKRINDYKMCCILDTKDFGEIDVVHSQYSQINIGDNITFYNDPICGFWIISKVNGQEIKEPWI